MIKRMSMVRFQREKDGRWGTGFHMECDNPEECFILTANGHRLTDFLDMIDMKLFNVELTAMLAYSAEWSGDDD